MMASEILMCGLKHVPFAGPAFEVLDSIKLKHELLGQSDRLAEIEGKLSRFERRNATSLPRRCGRSSTTSDSPT